MSDKVKKYMSLDELVSSLTIDEKIVLLSGKDFWHTRDIKRMYIPSVMASDGPHGLRKQSDTADNLGINDSITAVCFPSGAGLASSFDKKLMYKVGRTLGEECQAENVAVLLGPAINIKRSPLCGRNFEYLSEDPVVAGEMSSSYIDGVQSTGTLTSLKHFAVNNQESRRMTVSAEVDERALREIYLKGFETAVRKSQPATVMCSYNKLNGEYVSESKKLLTDILRDKWDFKGFVVSDWGAVNNRSKGLSAGLDLEMPGSSGMGAKNIKFAIEKGEIDEECIDISVKRILNKVFKWKQNRQQFEFNRSEHHQIAKETALKTMVLLKNENNVLPLSKKEKIAFIGELAQKPRFQGGGSSHIKPYDVVSVLDAVTKVNNVYFEQGYSLNEKGNNALKLKAVKLAKECDKVVIFAGLDETRESEGFDRSNMKLPENQVQLINAIADVNPNTVVVLHNGSPVEMPWIDKVPSVLESYLAGEAVGEAQVELLFGMENPSGKLAETFPVLLSDTPSYQNFPGWDNNVEYRESIFVGYRYYNTFNKKVLFPFGHGLSYTTFKYSDLKVDNKNIYENHGSVITLTVTNTGEYAGGEAIQLYISKPDSSVFRSKIELKAFEKVYLEKGESKSISFRLSEKDFAYFNIKQNDFVCENGNYEILIGSSSEDIRLRDVFVLNGFKNYENPYTKEVNEAYMNSDVTTIPRETFEKLLGRKIQAQTPPTEYTFEHSIAEMDTKRARIAVKVINSIKFGVDEGMGNSQMAKSSAFENPIRSMVSMSQGLISENMGKAILDILNDKKMSTSMGKLLKASIKNIGKKGK